MYSSLNSNGSTVWAKDAEKGEKYFCPCCNEPTILKSGKIKAPHFAHKSHHNCDPWYSEMSDWHREWQERFPLNCREVVIRHNGERHRADICIGKYIIEFQNSYLSDEQFIKRTEFYTSAGYKLIWVFNVKNKNIIPHRRRNVYNWKNPVNTFKRFDTSNKDVFLYFDMNDTDRPLHRIDWLCRDGNRFSPKYFAVFCKGPFRINNFVNYIKAGFM